MKHLPTIFPTLAGSQPEQNSPSITLTDHIIYHDLCLDDGEIRQFNAEFTYLISNAKVIDSGSDLAAGEQKKLTVRYFVNRYCWANSSCDTISYYDLTFTYCDQTYRVWWNWESMNGGQPDGSAGNEGNLEVLKSVVEGLGLEVDAETMRKFVRLVVQPSHFVRSFTNYEAGSPDSWM